MSAGGKQKPTSDKPWNRRKNRSFGIKTMHFRFRCKTLRQSHLSFYLSAWRCSAGWAGASSCPSPSRCWPEARRRPRTRGWRSDLFQRPSLRDFSRLSGILAANSCLKIKTSNTLVISLRLIHTCCVLHISLRFGRDMKFHIFPHCRTRMRQVSNTHCVKGS